MAKRSIKSKDYKIGFSNFQKKSGVNFWRFFFVAVHEISGENNTFFIEFESLNPEECSKQPIFSLRQKNITSENLQSALLGNTQELTDINEPKSSYYVLRIGKLGKNPKQLCKYYSAEQFHYDLKRFEISLGNNVFSENKISGFIDVSKEETLRNSEFLTNCGYANWQLEYRITDFSTKGYISDKIRWFPLGLKAEFKGIINFDGEDYLVKPQISNGYCERLFGNDFMRKWIHIHCSELTSMITGKKLIDSSFCIQGDFDNRISLVGNLEKINLAFFANNSKYKYNCVFDCTQVQGAENFSDQLLHWSFSINTKGFVIDIDIYCKIKELYNRMLECSEGSKKVINLLESGNGYGEIKYYKSSSKVIEQIEHAKLNKVVCEFGNFDNLGC